MTELHKWRTYLKEENGLVHLVHEIYEGDTPYPVVTHTFTGKTREEAQGYFDAHLETDEFFSAMENEGKWKDIEGKTKQFWK